MPTATAARNRRARDAGAARPCARAWDHFTGTNALTRDMSVNIKGLQQVIATLRQSGHLPEGSSTDTGFYIDGCYLEAARVLD